MSVYNLTKNKKNKGDFYYGKHRRNFNWYWRKK